MSVILLQELFCFTFCSIAARSGTRAASVIFNVTKPAAMLPVTVRTYNVLRYGKTDRAILIFALVHSTRYRNEDKQINKFESGFPRGGVSGYRLLDYDTVQI
jgi:hypothetical protein